MELIEKYFPGLSGHQRDTLMKLGDIYADWNSKVNLISRKDMDHFFERHVLHSMSIARFVQFEPSARVLDVGTGGGFPGIPLAILFPENDFTLVDSINKKVRVVADVADQLSLKNLRAIHIRAEDLTDQYEYIVSRAVTAMPRFVSWTAKLLSAKSDKTPDAGIWYLKGGDLDEEMKDFRNYRVYNLADIYEEEFFETKKLVHLPARSIR